MSEFKGTPGPWKTSDHYEDVVTVLDGRGFEVVTAEHCLMLQDYAEKLGIDHWADDERAHLNLSDEEQSANAHLIAAAPELLEALQDFMAESSGNPKSCGHDFECICRFDKARAAISKALGK